MPLYTDSWRVSPPSMQQKRPERLRCSSSVCVSVDVLGRARDDDALDVAELLDLLEHVDDDRLAGEDEELLGNRLVHALADAARENDHSGLHGLHLASLGSDARVPPALSAGGLPGVSIAQSPRGCPRLRPSDRRRMAPVFHIGNVMQDNGARYWQTGASSALPADDASPRSNKGAERCV